jgi:hypothetical protein
MAEILTNVDILELLIINVYKGTPTRQDPCPLMVTIDPIDRNKRFVIDTSAQQVLNNALTEKLKDSDPRNPNTFQYAKEFVGKMVSELHRSGLCLIEDIPDSSDDPYKQVRKMFK